MTIRKSRESLGADLERKLLGGPLTFGMALASIRRIAELTQPQLARKLKISKQHVCDLEKGRKLVSTEKAARFAKILGHPEETLVKLALQDQVRKAGLKYNVELRAA
jgi:transcriptional regulator with XRE-family HTH domain